MKPKLSFLSAVQILYVWGGRNVLNSFDALEHIIDDAPGVAGHFRSFPIINPPVGDSSWADQTSACDQLQWLYGSPLLSHSCLEALSADLVVPQMAHLLGSPSMINYLTLWPRI